jgi:hypothetical protein
VRLARPNPYGFEVLRDTQTDLADIASYIVSRFDAFASARQTGRAVGEQRLERIESTTSDYVETTLKTLKSREDRSRWLGHFWHGVGFVALSLGVATSIWLSDRAIDMARGSTAAWPVVVLLGIKSLIIIALLVAVAK